MRLFTDTDAWNGGSIELLCLFRKPDTAVQAKCSAAVWSWPQLQGPYARRDQEPTEQKLAAPGSEGARYGIASLPDAIGTVAFQTSFVDDDDGLWLYAGLPLGSLSRVLPVGAFPFGESKAESWEHVLHAWFFSLAEHIRKQVPFERGVIGWLTTGEVEELVAGYVPADRFHSYLVCSSTELICHPQNRKSAAIE